MNPFFADAVRPNLSAEAGNRASSKTGALGAIAALVHGDPGKPLFIRGVDDELSAVGRHVNRCAALARRDCLLLSGHCLDEPWRELCAALGIDPNRGHAELAARLLRATGELVVVLLEVTLSHWGATMIDALAGLPHELGRIIVLTPRALGHLPHQLLDAPANAEDGALYFQTLVESSRPDWAVRGRLHALERWWQARSREQPPRTPPTKGAATLRDRLLLGRRGANSELLAALGDRADWEQLTALGELSWNDGHALLQLTEPGNEADPQLVADALRQHARDSWGLMRAAELYMSVGATDDAREVADEALLLATDGSLRADLWERFDGCLGPHLSDDELAQYGAMALQHGNLHQARQLAQRAGQGDSFSVALMVGRVMRRCGDTHSSQQSLSRALALASNDAERATAHAELAELLVLSDRRVETRRCAETAISLTKDVAIELLARNAIGKTLLSAGCWEDAIAHFECDEQYASQVGRDEDALRARVNRAIAKMSLGHVVEARALLESILHAGERLDEPRARVFARANLATLAALVHDYADAIDLTATTIEDLRGSGDIVHTARQLINLAELRLAVGLLDEGEQALAQGRHACGPNVGDSLITFMSLVSARFQLARGRTLHAAVAADEAIAAARRCDDSAKLAEACQLAARIALEDGDVRRARPYVMVAAGVSDAAPASKAASAILEAAVARAAGEPFAPAAAAALALAEGVEDIDLRRQAHCLCLQAARANDEPELAEQHLRAACDLRNRLAASLPPSLRTSFLARKDLQPLAELERAWSPALERRATPSIRHRRTERPTRQLIGAAPAMRALRSATRKVGRSDATVLVLGESGTGKELIAEAIHQYSPRAAGALVKVNCAALVETLLLSELFGHEKGAFTGAHARRRGRFEQAHGGTIFLDEIGDIPAKTQVALLRVLQERSFERVGGSSTIDVDVRVVCATHRDLTQLVKQGRFREDLYYRLGGVVLDVPPLRQRPGDLPALATALLARIAQEQGAQVQRLDEDALQMLLRHNWPGNVRELENALRAAALFAEGHQITRADLTTHVAGLAYLQDPNAAPLTHQQPDTSESLIYARVRDGISLPEMKRALERACIESALAESGGNITEAAKLLGMKRPRLSQLVNSYAKGNSAAESTTGGISQ